MRTLDDIISDIRHECHSGITTRGPCKKCGQFSARGGGVCVACLEDELTSVCGHRLLAKAFTSSTQAASRALGRIQEIIEQKEHNEDHT